MSTIDTNITYIDLHFYQSACTYYEAYK